MEKKNSIEFIFIDFIVQTEINLYERTCKRLVTCLWGLAEGKASEARQAFIRLVSCLQKACKWLSEAH